MEQRIHKRRFPRYVGDRRILEAVSDRWSIMRSREAVLRNGSQDLSSGGSEDQLSAGSTNLHNLKRGVLVVNF